MNLLPQQNNRKPALTEKQEAFLDALFDNGSNVRGCMEVAGYAEGSGEVAQGQVSGRNH